MPSNSNRTFFARFLLAVLLSYTLAATLCAQTNMGTIAALVTDRSEAIVPGAAVIAKNMATGAEARTLTSSTGKCVNSYQTVGQTEIRP